MFTKFYIKKILLIAFVIFAGFGFSTKAEAATNIYYSVGQNTTDHKTGSPTVTIADGVATFSVAQTATNMGVGDIINYGGERAFISGKQSTSIWNVITATGTVPVATTTALVTSITHAFASLSSAVGGYVANNATSTNFMNTSDLVTGDFVLNIPCYYDSGPNTTALTIQGYTTGPNNYIRIYTATSTTSEVNQSQRHTGKWDTTKWRHDANNSFAASIKVMSPYVRLDGLQIRNTTATVDGVNGDVWFTVGGVTEETFISNNIFIGQNNKFYGIRFATGSNAKAYVWNNIFSGTASGISFTSTSYVYGTKIYNNTFYDLLTGVSINTFSNNNVTVINNIFASTTEPVTFAGKVANGSDYNSTATSSMNYTVVSGGNTHDATSTTLTFVDTATADFHLTSGATGALDTGKDLSSDASLWFNTDIDGEARPYNSVWDRGADEYFNVDTTPPNLSGGAPSSNLASNTTSTSLTLTTNENATCKYSTTADTAYASMTNTFGTTGGTSHSTTVSGLSSGHKYHYYIRCQDEALNPSTSDYEISFWVGSSGTTYAESCSRTDVNAAITVATVGDVVSVPAGSCIWGGSVGSVSVNKVITLQGAGRDVTVIDIPADATAWTGGPVINISAAATVKSFTIQATTTGNSGTAFSASANNFRITDIEYINQADTVNGYFVYFSAYGLIDNNDITGGGGTNELIFGRGPTDSWQTAHSMGTNDNLFIENNIFRGSGYVNDCNSNSRCVIRNNTVTGTMQVDGHGKASNSPARSVRHMEIYNNTWTTTSTGSWAAIEPKGGTGIIFNNSTPNQLPGALGSGMLFLRDYGYDAGPWPNFGSVYQCPSNYPVDDQVGVGKDPKVAGSEPFYLWNNIRGGISWPMAWWAIPAAAYTYCNSTYGDGTSYTNEENLIRYDRDYYNEVSSFDGTSGVGSGTLASRPSTCTTGVGYFATDQGSWNTSGSDGVLYKCTSTNTWTRYYMPYAYPHGLTASSTIGTDEIDIGAGARIFGNSKFYNIGTASGNTADLSVTPASGDLDNWLDVSVSTWENTGTRHKVWTENSDNFSSINTVHVVGDLEANTDYNVKVDDVLGQDITGDNCTGGVCTSNGSGKITFTYSGGYSEHEFDVEDHGSDTTAPVRSAGSPSGSQSAGTTQVTLSLTTDETATCKYSTTSGTAYGSMTDTFSTTGGTSHSSTITGLSNGNSYNYYIRCTDGVNPNSDDYTVSFSVAFPASSVTATTVTTVSANGPIVGANIFLPGQVKPRQQTIYPDGRIVYHDEPNSTSITPAQTQTTNTVSPTTTTYTFTRDLSLHSRGLDVKALQQYLNAKGFTIAKTGPGSPGNETTLFGRLTYKALVKFQRSAGLPATGYFGKMTRGRIVASE